jgi:hypothetical protein
MARRLNPWS